MQIKLVRLTEIKNFGGVRIHQLTPKPEEPFRFVLFDDSGERILVIGNIAFHLHLAIIAHIGDNTQLSSEVSLEREGFWRAYFKSGIVKAAGTIDSSHEVVLWKSDGLNVITPLDMRKGIASMIKQTLAKW